MRQGVSGLKLKPVLDVIGRVLIVVGLSMTLPLVFAIVYQETNEIRVFLGVMVLLLFVGTVAWKGAFTDEKLTLKEGILIGAIGWLIIPLFGSLPYLFSGTLPSIWDAYFEAVSGFTTTGATVIPDVESVARSVLLWRSFTQWLGGMGILLVLVALISNLGVDGARLLRSEMPGPKMSRVVPRMSSYAKSVWIVYITVTIIEVILLRLAGLDFFESLNHTFTSIATGGFSTRNAGLGAFGNPLAEFIVIFFMLVGGGNFALYYVVFTRKDPFLLWRDEEYRAYLLVILAAFVLAVVDLSVGYYENLFQSIRYGAFQIVSMKTGTGHISFDYEQWTNLSKMILFVLMFFGGCQCSTTGGIKMVRMLIGLKFVKGELAKTIHPQIVYPVRINNNSVSDQVVSNVIGFLLLYFVLFFITSLFLTAFGYDAVSSMTGSAAILGNVGPAMGVFGPNHTYGDLPNLVKLWLSFVMIMGRLEIYPVLISIQFLVSSISRRAPAFRN